MSSPMVEMFDVSTRENVEIPGLGSFVGTSHTDQPALSIEQVDEHDRHEPPLVSIVVG